MQEIPWFYKLSPITTHHFHNISKPHNPWLMGWIRGVNWLRSNLPMSGALVTIVKCKKLRPASRTLVQSPNQLFSHHTSKPQRRPMMISVLSNSHISIICFDPFVFSTISNINTLTISLKAASPASTSNVLYLLSDWCVTINCIWTNVVHYKIQQHLWKISICNHHSLWYCDLL